MNIRNGSHIHKIACQFYALNAALNYMLLSYVNWSVKSTLLNQRLDIRTVRVEQISAHG